MYKTEMEKRTDKAEIERKSEKEEMERKVDKAEAKVDKMRADIKAERKEAADKVKVQYFSADLEMDRINKYYVRYLVKNHHGLRIQGFGALEIDRRDFPNDDNFSMDFINEDIPAEAKTGDKDAPDGVAILLKKQEAFRKFKNLKLYIVAE